MKIAHLIGQYFPYFGGAEVCVHNVCRELSDEGNEALVVTTTPPPQTPPMLNYEITRLSPRTCGLLRRNWFLGIKYLHYSLAQLQKKHEFDLWQVTNGYPLGIHAVDFFKKRQIPCVLRCCGIDIQAVPEIAYGFRLDEKIDAQVCAQYPKFDGLVALTPTVKDEYLKLGIPEKKITIIPNGVETGRFASRRTPEVRQKIRSEFQVPEKNFLILTVGRYHPKKGYDFIPEIAANLKNQKIEFTWLVAGGDCSKLNEKFPECKDLNVRCVEKFAESAGDSGFDLPAQGLLDLYCAADIFAFPTLIETFGMVLVEAMAAGLPILSTECDGVKDVIKQDIDGLKVTPGDVDEFSQALADLLKDKVTRNRLSENALRSAANYDWQKVAGQYLNFYESVLH